LRRSKRWKRKPRHRRHRANRRTIRGRWSRGNHLRRIPKSTPATRRINPHQPMLEQVSTSVKFLAFYTASKQGKTGLTVTVDLYDPSGTQIVTGGSATAVGGGLYSYTLSSNNSTEGEYAAIFKTTDSTVDSQHIPSLWVLGRAGVENLDAATSTRLPSSSYTAAPSVTAIRTEMDSNSTKLANLDATISSRSTLTTGDLPSVPSAASVASAVRTELTEISNLDASISSRLAAADYTAPPTTAQISDAVEGSLLDENDGQAVLNAIVGAIGNQNVDEIALVAAIRSDLERSGGKLDNVPTAAANASAVWSAATKEITGGTVTNLTNAPASVTPADIWTYGTREITGGTVDTLVNAPSVPSASAIADEVRLELAPELSNLDAPVSGATAPTASTVASAVRTELSVELAHLDADISSRAVAGDIPASAITDIKAKTDLLNTDRLAQCSTVATTGAQIAAALS
ncbi:MAG: hypothetical protein ACO3GP_07745, partial [Candidatus Limnocylindrus sp.]